MNGQVKLLDTLMTVVTLILYNHTMLILIFLIFLEYHSNWQLIMVANCEHLF